MVDQNNRLASIGAFQPDEIDVTVAVNISRDQATVILTRGNEAKFLTSQIAELNTYLLVNAIRFKRCEVAVAMVLGFKRDDRVDLRMRFVSVRSCRMRVRNARKYKQGD